MEVARAAFAQNNREESRLVHSTGSAPTICERGHKSHAFPTELRKFVEVAVKGGNQGVIFCCVLATGLEALGAPDVGPQFALPFCLLTLLGLAITLGFLDYANRQAEKTFGENEREREKWECENYLEGEQKEMVELYDAETVIRLLSKNQELFLDIMMAEELGILPYSGLPPHLSGLVTGLGFFVIGALPLVAYSPPLSSLAFVSGIYGHSFGLLLAAAVILFVLGGIKNFYCIDLEAWWKQGVHMVGLQAVVVATAIGLGTLLQTCSLFPHGSCHPLLHLASSSSSSISS
ncbi:uncharacterized protein ACA1_182400 [Acanthamoeba castellanii str. Neff]|uniref:Integral membrane protein n=1 Tax=Acanthamoeba castellanii (strain ATCC 30010 / Neff) TaxID=1257118 RepID=L8H9C3_ACACF|nr:uncharacterized protein ACA1_182400 [Acanthamoeba castellanii str. Neff]ELR21338.1 integral membrane protein [Acanthamoeba castellanii str. Neff]